jgi:asparagine synthase (glutamine-hydrolysing)
VSTTGLWPSPPPGAVAIVAGPAGRDPSAARLAAQAAFRERGEPCELFADGPLAVAWNPSADRTVHVSESGFCLIEGTLYETGVPRPSTGASEGSRGRDADSAELLAAAYAGQGDSALTRLRGDFWALIWDRRARRGVVVADHMGGRCPHFARERGDIVIASEVAELLAALPRRPDPDPVALAHWLLLTAPPHGGTLVAGVRRLEAGHRLSLGAGDERPTRYWSPSYRTPVRMPRDEAAARLREVLSTAVARRLNDCASAGVLLSGGLDSSVVAALGACVHPRLRAYSATFPGYPTVDESELIDRTLAQVGLRSTRISVRGGSVLAGAAGYTGVWRLPPTSPNLFFWQPLLERAGMDGTGVMLDGEGGDELFGFSPYLLADRLRGGRPLSALALARHWPPPMHPDSPARVLLRLRRFGVKGAMPPAAHGLIRRVRRLEHYAPPWMSPTLARGWLAGERSGFSWKELPGPRWWASIAAGVTRGVGPATVYEQSRRRAALAGLQARHPLVDVDVIELVLGLEPELAFDPRFSRPLLRASVAGLLPDEVRLRREKSSFDALFHAILAGPELTTARRLLAAREAELRAYVDLDSIERQLLAVDPPAAGPARQVWALRVWRLLTAECWLRSQADASFLPSIAEREGLPGADYELRALA